MRLHVSDRYRVIRELGRGGMATVFLADDLRHGRQVAIKVLDAEVAAAVGSDRFLREIEIEARLSHPHILPLHDSGNAGGLAYYVMPYVEGESLRARLEREPQLPIEEAVRLGREVADALAHAHAHGVIHRDIKPENILIADGHAMLADFGVARALSEGPASLTRTGVAVGTPTYMSPEQALGDKRIDERTDLYSLGCVLFEMVAGRAPFVGATAESVAHQHLSVAPPRVADLRPTVPAKLDAAIRRALAKSPADRFANARQFERALADAEKAPAAAPRRSSRPLQMALAGVLLALTVGVLAWWMHGGATAGRVSSLAVLPLADLSGDRQQEYFADGMTDELIGCLSQISALRVISRTSVMRFKDTRQSLPQIARMLGVDALVEGSVLRAGDRVRIAADLVQARPERNLWGDRYERPIRDVLALQSEVARTIAARIAIAITPSERQRLARSEPVNPAAHDEVLRGRFYLGKLEASGFREALVHFQRAVEIDPGMAPAWSGLAEAYYELSNIALPPAEAMEKSRAAARKALERDPDLAQAHASLGVVMAEYDWDWAGAEREYRRALDLDASDALTHIFYAFLLTNNARHDEALREYGFARRLDPLSSLNADYEAWGLFLARRYDEAAGRYRALEAADTGDATPHYSLGQIYEAQGRMDDAIAEYRRGALHGDNGWPYALLGHALAVTGRTAEARAVLNRLEHPPEGFYVQYSSLALIHLGLGDRDRFFALLEQAYAAHDENLVWLPPNPMMDSVRSDPRFRDLARRMHVPA